MDSIAPSSLIVMRLFSRISASARLVFRSVTDVRGRRSWGSFSTRSLPCLKHLHHSYTRVRERHSSPYRCWSLWWISADRTFSTTRNLITMHCSTLRGTFCSLITLATRRTEQVLTRAGGRVEVVASLSQGRTAAAQCGLFTQKSVLVVFEPPCNIKISARDCLSRLLWLLAD